MPLELCDHEFDLRIWRDPCHRFVCDKQSVMCDEQLCDTCNFIDIYIICLRSVDIYAGCVRSVYIYAICLRSVYIHIIYILLYYLCSGLQKVLQTRVNQQVSVD